MKYVLILTEDDGTAARVFGTASGQAFANLEAAKWGRSRLIEMTGYPVYRVICSPVESTRNIGEPIHRFQWGSRAAAGKDVCVCGELRGVCPE